MAFKDAPRGSRESLKKAHAAGAARDQPSLEAVESSSQRIGHGPLEKKLEPAPRSKNAGVSTTTKTLLLLALVFQNATLNIAARRSRVAAAEEEERSGCGLRNTTVVVTIESVKILMAFLLFALERKHEHGLSVFGTIRAVARITSQHRFESAKILVPACLYVCQNNLLLVAADNLEGPVLALFGQIKILATALFSVVLLRRTLGCRRWVSLFVLTGSIATVQLSQMRQTSGDEGSKNLVLGLCVTAIISTISGFSGVYFELVLKASPISVWVRNIHLATISTLIALAAVYSNDLAAVKECGFFAGYNNVVAAYVAVQAGGGLLIAAVIKYADNILKAFATSVAIIVVSAVSALFYSFHLTRLFFVGTFGVIYAVFLYGDLLKDLPLCRRLP
ncbi:hypothetical protein CTAYLR_009029 [Chrysophaeum taylorii]|uniref:Uncharacterized protein n=1 Tax=Chrysophaeum taylorii TaxID=2483200 RepID=A0AAD7UDR7_9STRA|nr:hypothetical protein CTAYLR_009029 [Chrysophaeum taylorii]